MFGLPARPPGDVKTCKEKFSFTLKRPFSVKVHWLSILECVSVSLVCCSLSLDLIKPLAKSESFNIQMIRMRYRRMTISELWNSECHHDCYISKIIYTFSGSCEINVAAVLDHIWWWKDWCLHLNTPHVSGRDIIINTRCETIGLLCI